MINTIISTITSTFKKLTGGSCWKVILMVAVLVAAAGFIYYKFFYNKSEIDYLVVGDKIYNKKGR